MKITYKRNEIETTKEFDCRNDLIEFVILNNIKDDELVSIDLYGETIEGGINGLALYTLRKINEEREAENDIAEIDDCWCDDCDCDDCDFNCNTETFDSDKHVAAKVLKVYNGIDEVCVEVKGFSPFHFLKDEKVKIIRHGYRLSYLNDQFLLSSIAGEEIVEIPASRLHKNDILVNELDCLS